MRRLAPTTDPQTGPSQAAGSGSDRPESDQPSAHLLEPHSEVQISDGHEQQAAKSDIEALLEWQREILPGVSRTFALTIPALPPKLCTSVTTAYLLCRIADTIEDEPALATPEKLRFSAQFVQAVEGTLPAEQFARDLHPELSDGTLPAERELVAGTASAIGVLQNLPEVQRAALVRCIRIMCEGMERFQLAGSPNGLKDGSELDQYCYHVAGVVGETLTELFCDHSPEIEAQRKALAGLSVSFGQGLQMTNILKDIWDDLERGVCWLPQDCFDRHGFDLKDLAQLAPSQPSPEAFQAGLGDLIGKAHGHLRDALDYTLLMPVNETGIRRFSLWAIGMAMLTLRKINRQRNFRSSLDVKIKRSSVKATVGTTNLIDGSNWMLRAAFRSLAVGLPKPIESGARDRSK